MKKSGLTDHPATGELPSNRIAPNAKMDFILKTVDTLDISTKVELLQKITTGVAVHAKKLESLEKRLSEVNENPPSPLSTHTGESTCSSLFDESKMEPLFPFEDPVLPIIPSAPLMF